MCSLYNRPVVYYVLYDIFVRVYFTCGQVLCTGTHMRMQRRYVVHIAQCPYLILLSTDNLIINSTTTTTTNDISRHIGGLRWQKKKKNKHPSLAQNAANQFPYAVSMHVHAWTDVTCDVEAKEQTRKKQVAGKKLLNEISTCYKVFEMTWPIAHNTFPKYQLTNYVNLINSSAMSWRGPHVIQPTWTWLMDMKTKTERRERMKV